MPLIPLNRKVLLNGPSIDPRSIPGLTLWVDAMDLGTLTFSTSPDVSQWSDKSGLGNHMTNGTANQQPLYLPTGLNGKPTIQFADDATTKNLSCADNATMDFTEFAAFAVIQREADAGAPENVFNKWKPTGNLREFRLFVNATDGFTCQVTQDGLNVRSASPAGVLAQSTAYIVDASTTSATAFRAAVNHGVDGTQTMTNIFAGAAPLVIGAHGDFGERFTGYISEVLWYTKALSTSQRFAILSYLSSKWGIAIA